MHGRPRLNRSNDGQPIEMACDPGHQPLREPDITIACRVEVGRQPRPFLQIEGIDVTGRPGKKDEDAIPRASAGSNLCRRLHFEGAGNLGEVVARECGTGHPEKLPPAEARTIPKRIVYAPRSAACESILRGHALTPLLPA